MSEQDQTQQQADPPVENTAQSAPEPVPYARFREVVTERNALRDAQAEWKAAQLEHRAALEAMQSEHAKALEAATQRAAELEAASKWKANEVELARQGVHDPEIVDYLRHRYSTAPVEEGQERPAFGEWFGSYKASEPAVLRPFLGSGNEKPKPPPTNKGAEPVGNTSAMDPRKIAAMTPEQYRENREQLLKGAPPLKIR